MLARLVTAAAYGKAPRATFVMRQLVRRPKTTAAALVLTIGLRESPTLRKLAGWASAYDMLLAPHNVCGPLGTAANLHLAVATGNYKVLEPFNDFADPWVSDLVHGAPAVDPADGCFALPAAPGLGVSLDREAAARHPRTGVHFNLFADGWERRDARPGGEV